MGKLRAREGKAQAEGTHLRGVGPTGSWRISNEQALLSHSEEPSAEPVSQHSATEQQEVQGPPGKTGRDLTMIHSHWSLGQSSTKEPLPPGHNPLQTRAWQPTQLTPQCPCVFPRCPFDMEHACLSLWLGPLAEAAHPWLTGCPALSSPAPVFPPSAGKLAGIGSTPLPGVQPSHITREQQ